MSTPKRKPTLGPKGWSFGFPVTSPDERVNPENAEYGKRTRTSVYGIDSRGALWRYIDTAEPVFLGFPPPIP